MGLLLSSNAFCHDKDKILATEDIKYPEILHKIIDDILGEQVNARDVVKQCRAVLEVLEKINVKAKGTKISFVSKVNYAGIRLSGNACLPSTKIMDSIINLANPKILAILGCCWGVLNKLKNLPTDYKGNLGEHVQSTVT